MATDISYTVPILPTWPYFLIPWSPTFTTLLLCPFVFPFWLVQTSFHIISCLQDSLSALGSRAGAVHNQMVFMGQRNHPPSSPLLFNVDLLSRHVSYGNGSWNGPCDDSYVFWNLFFWDTFCIFWLHHLYKVSSNRFFVKSRFLSALSSHISLEDLGFW